jgi:hypothetical protein
MQTYLWNPWSIFDELERSMFAAGSAEWPRFDIEDIKLTSGGIAAKLKGLLGDPDKRQAA